MVVGYRIRTCTRYLPWSLCKSLINSHMLEMGGLQRLTLGLCKAEGPSVALAPRPPETVEVGRTESLIHGSQPSAQSLSHTLAPDPILTVISMQTLICANSEQNPLIEQQ